MNRKENMESLASVCRMLYDRKLTYSAGGNVSMREGDTVYITPSGVNKGMLQADDIVIVNMDGGILSKGVPSIEIGIHLALYKKCPEITAIVHCHPLFATALSVKNEALKAYTPEGALLLGKVAMVPYKMPGTKDLVDAVAAEHVSNAMIMANHGALTKGRTLMEAFNRMEELEFQAMMQFYCADAEPLPDTEVMRLRMEYL